MNQINYWRVASYALLATSFGGLVLGIALNTGYTLGAIATMVAYGIMRLEWFIDALNNSKDEYAEPTYE